MKNITIDGIDYQIVPVDTTKEEEIKQLFYPNGSVVYPPKKGQDYWAIEYCVIFSKVWGGHVFDRNMLKRQGVFITERSCKNAYDVDKTHAKLLRKITKINAENGWVVDWDDDYQDKYTLRWNNCDKKKAYIISSSMIPSCVAMCKEALDFMLSNKVLNKDFKKFLKIYN